jgi:hypothetical protein
MPQTDAVGKWPARPMDALTGTIHHIRGESTTTRKADGLDFLASGSCRWQEKTEALLCF